MVDDGLLPPPLPVPKPPSIPRGPDLEPGFVTDQLSWSVDSENSHIGSLATAGTTQTSGNPTFKSFTSNPGADVLRPVDSKLENAVDASSPEAALARFLGSSVLSPFTSAVDQYQVSKIRDAQQKFYQDHGQTLKNLSQDLSDARRAMKDLASWVSQQHLPDNGIRDIMQQKAATGNQAMSDLNDALASATDPDDRAKLQAMKSDFDKWTADRDARLKPEWKEETDLENRIDKIDQVVAFGQPDTLMSAAMSNGPTIETGGGNVISSTHQQPQALSYVQGLRDFLLGDRYQMIKTVRADLDSRDDRSVHELRRELGPRPLQCRLRGMRWRRA